MVLSQGRLFDSPLLEGPNEHGTEEVDPGKGSHGNLHFRRPDVVEQGNEPHRLLSSRKSNTQCLVPKIR